jgi:hypothetical protein
MTQVCADRAAQERDSELVAKVADAVWRWEGSGELYEDLAVRLIAMIRREERVD